MRVAATMKLILVIVGLAAATVSAQNRDLQLAPQASRRLALVIGNDTYAGSPLINARNDARSMAQALRQLSFDVTVVEDGTRLSIGSAMLAFGRRLTDSDLGLVFYAGHGVQVEGVNYLIPVDFTGRSEDEVRLNGISSDEVTRTLQRARVGVLVLDACRDNPFSGQRSVGRGLAQLEARGLLVAFATGAGQTASDGAGANGVFTSELVQLLGTPGRGLRDTFFDVQRRVQVRTKGHQFPAVYSQLIDDVVLTPRAMTTAAPTVDANIEALSSASNPSSPATPPPLAGRSRADLREPSVQWAYIPVGAFEMGCTAGDTECEPSELPRHDVVISRPFELMTTEVTVALADRLDMLRLALPQPSWSRPDYPFVSIDLFNAQELCKRLGGRLPTEVEWEYAARGGQSVKYPWGNQAPTCMAGRPNGARFDDDADCDFRFGFDNVPPNQGPGKVATFPPNPFGLHDMSGNVMEWVDTRYSAYGSAPPPDSWKFVVRGGAFMDRPQGLRVSARGRDGTALNVQFPALGFRCARDVR
jgi:formylglycine-generating enzyme required for sulfatase activity